MRLCQHAVYIKLTSYADLLDSGAYLELIDALERWAGVRFDTYRDLAATRARPLVLDDVRAQRLEVHRGAGFHQSARFRLSCADADLPTVEVNAGLHPYSGVYAVQVDARVSAERANDDTDGLEAMVRDWIARFTPLLLNVHDVDDDAVQNIDSPRLAELGYGRSAPADPDGRPGREAVRGQFRLAPTWLTYLAGDALELLGADSDAPAVNKTPLAGGMLYRLAGRPDAADTPAFREAQRALRDVLGFDALAQRDRYTHGYWKKKQ